MAEPEAAVVGTTIMDLPNEIKFKILNMLDNRDKKVAKLVCSDWYLIISHLASYSFALNDDSINVLKNYIVSTIPTLMIYDLSELLPIYSSKRICIPKARVLKFCDYDPTVTTAENMLKLIRFYAKHCKSLEIKTYMPYFASIKPYQMKTAILLDNLVKLAFFVIGPSNSPQHLKSLSQFLLSLKVPNLRMLECEVHPGFVIEDPSTAVTTASYLSELSVLTTFSAALATFLKKYSKQVKCLKAFMPSLEHMQILTEFSNLEWLELGISGLSRGEITFPKLLSAQELSELFGKVKALKSLSLELNLHHRHRSPVIDLLELLPSCSNNLEHFYCDMYQISGPAMLDWLYSGFQNLTKLELIGVNNDNIALRKYALNGFKLLALQELELDLKCNWDNEGDDWRTDVIKWICQVCPKLTTLILDHSHSCPRFQLLCLQHIYSIIMGLSHVKLIEIGGHSRLDVSKKVKVWFVKYGSNQTISGCWGRERSLRRHGLFRSSNCCFAIRISRPLIEPQLPPNFRPLV